MAKMTRSELQAAYQNLTGFTAAYVLDGVEVFRGTVEYVTRDLWAGIRSGYDAARCQAGRVDEVPVQRLVIVPEAA